MFIASWFFVVFRILRRLGRVFGFILRRFWVFFVRGKLFFFYFILGFNFVIVLVKF